MNDWQPDRSRERDHWRFLAAVAVVVFLVGWSPIRSSWAQDAKPADAPAPTAPAPTVPTATAPTAPEGAAAQPPTVKPAEEKSYLAWMIQSSGPVGAVLFVMSFMTLAITIKLVVELRRKNMIPPDLESAFDVLLQEKRYQEAFDLARSSESYLGKVLAAGLMKISLGYPDAVEAMQEVGDDENMRIEHRLSWLAILGTASPLLGLLGTVEGIIASFRVIANSETQPKPSLLAAGISTSLFNTFEGLFVAIMATVAFMLLKNQAARLSLEVGMAAGNLMSRFKTRGASGPGPATYQQG